MQEQTAAPVALTIDLRANEKAATKDGQGEDLPAFEGHIYAGNDGRFPTILNDWESTVLAPKSLGHHSSLGTATHNAQHQMPCVLPTKTRRGSGRRCRSTTL